MPIHVFVGIRQFVCQFTLQTFGSVWCSYVVVSVKKKMRTEHACCGQMHGGVYAFHRAWDLDSTVASEKPRLNPDF